MQVLEWISYHVEKNKYDASIIDFSCCNMDGHTLCHCSRDQMRHIFGPLGDELYDRLHEISECPNVPFVPKPRARLRPPAPCQNGTPGAARGGTGSRAQLGWAQLLVGAVPHCTEIGSLIAVPSPLQPLMS